MTCLGAYLLIARALLITSGPTLDTILWGIMLYTWDIRMMALMTRPDSLSAIASLKRLKS